MNTVEILFPNYCTKTHIECAKQLLAELGCIELESTDEIVIYKVPNHILPILEDLHNCDYITILN